MATNHTHKVVHLQVRTDIEIVQCACRSNESTAGADASVEMSKLHNIKLLIAFIHTLPVNKRTWLISAHQLIGAY